MTIRPFLYFVLMPALLLLAQAVPAHADPAPARPAPAGCTGRPSDTWINVAVEGLRSDSGLVAITLYADNPRKFLVRNGSLYVGRVPAHEGTTTGCIFVPDPGVYALAIYHDENGDQIFNRTALGLPAEGYGFANNPSTLAGLPSFQSVRLAIPRAGLLTRVRIKYP
ncbi:DUF2141 domain-containing protein [Novosphingobium bradum]|uniref:DUF2141 domain-containing protein n=1 Tax=Novosphingobium bradum TaxID=1737444 RepID=A0ABV7IVH8_9SPHN